MDNWTMDMDDTQWASFDTLYWQLVEARQAKEMEGFPASKPDKPEKFKPAAKKPSSKPPYRERNIQAAIMQALSQAGCLVWRNNTGALPDRRGILVRYGLCIGSSDIIGIMPDGRFLAVEVKTKTGRVTEAQENFLAAVRARGGVAGVCRSVEDALRLVHNA